MSPRDHMPETTTDKKDIRDRFPDVMPFVDALNAACGGGVKIVHIKNNKTGDEMQKRDNIEPSNSLNSSQYLKLGKVKDQWKIEDEKAATNGRK